MSDQHVINVLGETQRSLPQRLLPVAPGGKGCACVRWRHDHAQDECPHISSRCTYGSPRMTEALRDQGESVGPNRVARLMRESGLQGRTKRRYRVRTTDRAHDHPIADNLPANAPEPTKPGEVWVADIT